MKADLFQRAESGAEVIIFIVPRLLPVRAAGKMDVMEVFPAGQKRRVITRFFNSHVIEVTHHTDRGMIHVLADRGGVGQLPQKPSFVPVQWFHQNPRTRFLRVIPNLFQKIDQNLSPFHMAECRLTVKRGNNDQTGRSQFPGGGQDFFHRFHALFPRLLLLGNRRAFKARADGAHLNAGSFESLFEFLHPFAESTPAGFEAFNPPFLHVFNFLFQRFAWKDPFLAGKAQTLLFSPFSLACVVTTPGPASRPAPSNAPPVKIERRILSII